MSKTPMVRHGLPGATLLSRLSVFFVVMMTAGCSGGPDRIYNFTIYRGDPSSYVLAGDTAKRPVPVQISGNPFGIAPATLANISASSIQSAFPNRQVVFTAVRAENARSDIAMRIAFDPPNGTTGIAVCAARGPLLSYPTSEEIRTVMALCFGDQPISGIEGRLSRSHGVGDAEFVTLLRDMTRRMFTGSSQNR